MLLVKWKNMTYSEKYDLITKAIRDKGNEILPSGSRIVLYGSRARGDFREDSDWDIHILIPGENRVPLSQVDSYLFPLTRLGWEYDEEFSTILYSYGDWEKRKYNPFYENVEKDKIIILKK